MYQTTIELQNPFVQPQPTRTHVFSAKERQVVGVGHFLTKRGGFRIWERGQEKLCAKEGERQLSLFPGEGNALLPGLPLDFSHGPTRACCDQGKAQGARNGRQ